MNNQFHCVKCDKVIGRFSLKYITFDDIMNEPKKYYLNVNKMDICSTDNEAFGLTLEHSYLIEKNERNHKKSEQIIFDAYQNLGSFVFESGILPIDFDIENLYLRESETHIYYYTQKADSFLFICLTLISLVIFGFLIVLVNIIYIVSKSKFSKLFNRFLIYCCWADI